LQTLIAIGVDIAFIVFSFCLLFFVRPDLHKEDGQSLLEFRDPLSLGPRKKILERTNIFKADPVIIDAFDASKQ